MSDMMILAPRKHYDLNTVQHILDDAATKQNLVNMAFGGVHERLSRIDELAQVQKYLPRAVFAERLTEHGRALADAIQALRFVVLPLRAMLIGGYEEVEKISRTTTDVQTAIEAFLGGDDNGEALRQVFIDHPINKTFAAYIDDQKAPHRPFGRSPAWTKLVERADELKRKTGARWKHVADQIKEDWLDSTDEVEHQAAVLLEGNNPAGYLMKEVSAFRRSQKMSQ